MTVDLSPRQTAVRDLLTSGLSNKEIARTLGISYRTVEYHRAVIMAKYGAKNAFQLMRRILTEERQ